MLWLYQRVFFGRASDEVSHHMPDLDFREYAIIVPLIVMMLWMGTFTQSFIPSISSSTALHSRADRRAPQRSMSAMPRRAPTAEPGRSWPVPANFLPTGDDYLRILPEIIMTAGGTLMLLIEPLVRQSKRTFYGAFFDRGCL